MSKELHIRNEVCAAVRAAGFDPSDIIDVQVTPSVFYVTGKVFTSRVRGEVEALCEAAGHDSNSVASLKIGPDSIQFEVYIEPRQQGADGPLTVFVTYPYC